MGAEMCSATEKQIMERTKLPGGRTDGNAVSEFCVFTMARQHPEKQAKIAHTCCCVVQRGGDGQVAETCRRPRDGRQEAQGVEKDAVGSKRRV